MRLAQLSIASAVAGAAAYWKWTDNGYLIAVWAFCAAYGFTLAYMKLAELLASPADRAAAAAYAREVEEANRVIDDPSIRFCPGKFTEDPGPLWIGNQRRNLIDITPEPPALDSLKGLPGPTDPGPRSKGGGGSKR